MQSRALKIIGLEEEQALKKYGIVSTRDFIASTCINVLKRILSDPTHPLTTKLSRENLRPTRSRFQFEYSRARTEVYNNSIVPWGIRLLRDGREDVYKPIARTLKRARNKKRPAAINNNSPRPVTKTKPRASTVKMSMLLIAVLRFMRGSVKRRCSHYQQQQLHDCFVNFR